MNIRDLIYGQSAESIEQAAAEEVNPEDIYGRRMYVPHFVVFYLIKSFVV
jgi:hypothetical protein